MKLYKNIAINIASISLFAILIWQLDWQSMGKAFTELNLLNFAAAIGITCVSYLSHSLRWMLFFPEKTAKMKVVFKSVVVGHMFNALLPSKSGELIRPLFLRRATGIAYSNILATCVIERIADGFILLFCLGVGILYLGTNASILKAGIFMTLFYCLVALALAYMVNSKNTRSLAMKVVPTRYREKASEFLEELIQGTKRLNGTKQYALLIAHSLIYWALNISAIWVLLQGLNLPPQAQTFSVSLLMIGTLGVALAMPSAPANLGIYHFAVYSVLGMATGVLDTNNFLAHEPFMAAALIIHLAALIPDLIVGAGCYFSFPSPAKNG